MSARDVGSVPWRRELAGTFSAFQALFPKQKLERRKKRQAARLKTRLDVWTR